MSSKVEQVFTPGNRAKGLWAPGHPHGCDPAHIEVITGYVSVEVRVGVNRGRSGRMPVRA